MRYILYVDYHFQRYLIERYNDIAQNIINERIIIPGIILPIKSYYAWLDYRNASTISISRNLSIARMLPYRNGR